MGNYQTLEKAEFSKSLLRALSMKERKQWINDLDDIKISEQEVATFLHHWKEESLMNDKALKERLVMEQFDEEIFGKIIAISKDPHWIHTYQQEKKPAWMEWLEEAFQLNRTHLVEEKGQLHISLAFRPFTLWAKQKLHEFYCSHPSFAAKVNWKLLRSSLLFHLASELTNIGARTIILEMYIARKLKELEGETPVERYLSFVKKKLMDPDSLEFIYKEYPVLARLLMIRTNYYVEMAIEALIRFDHDVPRMHHLIGEEDLPLIGISAGMGDSHQKGHTVMRFTFSTQKELLYKPKSLAITLHFHQFLHWMNEQGFTPKLRGYEIIDCGDYAWEQCVIDKECKTEEQVANYYKRLGGYLAILYLLNGTDFHHENIIADGEYPTLIDLETLFHHIPEFKIAQTAEVKAKLQVVHSVLGTALLPHLFYKSPDGRGVDISGISGKEQELPNPVLQVENEGTDEMRFVRKKAIMKINGKNVPKWNGQQAEGAIYVDSIIEGFQRAAQIILQHKGELLGEKGLLAMFKEDEIRIVIRPTQYYGNFVLESQHPDYMRDGMERDKLLDRLWFTVLDTRQIPYEKKDLFNGDIPFFTTKPGSTDLFSSTGEKIPHFFKTSSYQLSEARIKGLTMEKIEQQCDWIAASVGSNALKKVQVKEINFNQMDLPEDNRDLFIGEARKIGAQLLEKAIYGEKNDATWIGLETNYYGQKQVSSLDRGLYNGLSGIALFLAYLGKVTGDKEFMSLSLQTMESILQAPIHVRNFPSAFFGQASILYVLSHFIALYGENEKWTNYRKGLIEEIGKNVETDTLFDLLGGSAGIIQVLLNEYEQYHDEQSLGIARLYGIHLLKNKHKTRQGIGWLDAMGNKPLGGFSHGTSGIAWSLFRLSRLTHEDEFFETAIEALKYDRSLYHREEENWKDIRCTPHKISDFPAYWCHGAAGIGLSRVLYLSYMKDPLLLQEIETAINTTLKRGMGRSHSLCHGDLGNAELFLQAGKTLSNPAWIKTVSYTHLTLPTTPYV
jgi:type 2 lantibiotic biosynthesis protein LanM